MREMSKLGPLELELLAELRAAPAGTRAVVMDIGANDGAWSAAWHQPQLEALRREQRIDLVMVEPLPSLGARLARQAAAQNATFIAAAVSRREGHASFATGNRKDRARLGETDVDHRSGHRVRVMDAAALLRSHLPASGGYGFVKLDVEGHEFELLPWLLAQGGLCRARYLLVEWHINTVEPRRRLSALGLRLAFHEMLEHGCSEPPRAVYYDDYVPNNMALPVPGLPRVAMEHSAWAGRSVGGSHVLMATSGMENQDYRSLFGGERTAAAGGAPPYAPTRRAAWARVRTSSSGAIWTRRASGGAR